MTAPLVTHLARQMKVEIDSGYPGGAQAWIPLKGYTSLVPSISPTMQSTNDYDSDGWTDSTKTMLAWGLNMTLLRKGVDESTFDPAQQVIRNAAYAFGDSGVVHVRWYDREGGDEAYEGYAEVQWAPAGGGPDALDSVSVTLTGKGARLTIANPIAVPEAPTVSTRSPASGPAAGGTLVSLVGDNFTGVTTITIGTTAVTNFQIVGDQNISLVTPARAAGAFVFVLTSPAGVSTGGPTYTFT